MSKSGWHFKGGANVPHNKRNTENLETTVMSVPNSVQIPMLHHIGAPCLPTVKKGDYVKVGQLIGDSDKPVSAPIYSSVSGTVKDVSPILTATGAYVDTVVIDTDGLQIIDESVQPHEYNTYEELIALVRKSGLVGLGGAGFPTHIKLRPVPGKKIEYILINAAECEPYITSDYRMIMENSERVIGGIQMLLDMLPDAHAIIGVEDNKPEAIKILTKIADSSPRIDIVKLRSRYPQGAEKMLIYALTKRKVAPGKLPIDAGCVVMNVTSVTIIDEYIKTGMPIVRKRITVDGSAVAEPKVVDVPIGALIGDVFKFCGGFKTEPSKIIMGGPMMGTAQPSLQNSVLKQTNALLAFEAQDAALPPESECIRCGKCVEACPMSLMPLYLNINALAKDVEGLQRYHVSDCMECGSCSFVCPARRYLVQSIRLGKAVLRESMQQQMQGGKK